VIELDPGLSFGTGQHPTTVFCLEELVTRRVPGERQSFLDLGTGSGILAIAAAKLGYSPVEACDFDPDALRTARANARENGVAQRIRFGTADVSKLPARAARSYDVVCANLISNLLVAARKRILARVAPGGALVLAGILATEFDEVRRVYESAGLRMLASATRNEWRSVSFSNTHP
jgi:ribosomal protein L11 methyltransferase